jgi:hypothetical protein
MLNSALCQENIWGTEDMASPFLTSALGEDYDSQLTNSVEPSTAREATSCAATR